MSGRKGSTSDKENKTSCGHCSQLVGKKQKGLQCELCEIWYHTSCEKIDDGTYECILKDSERANPLLHWYCSKKCNIIATKFLGGMARLEKRVDDITQRVDQVDSRVQSIEEEIPKLLDTKTEEQMAKIESKIPGMLETQTKQQITEIENKIPGMLKSKAKEQMAEIENRAWRKTNLIMFKVPERADKDIETRKQEDGETVGKLLDEIKTTHKPHECRRIGTQDKNSAKSRPIRIAFETEAARDEVLKEYHKMRKALLEKEEKEEDFICLRTNVRKDLTLQEREEEEQLYQDLRKKRDESKESGDEYAHWIRRGGKVVNIGRYPRSSRDKTQ